MNPLSRLFPRNGGEENEKSEAERVIEKVKAQHHEMMNRWPTIHQAVQEIEIHRGGNHFGERIADAYRGRTT